MQCNEIFKSLLEDYGRHKVPPSLLEEEINESFVDIIFLWYLPPTIHCRQTMGILTLGQFRNYTGLMILHTLLLL